MQELKRIRRAYLTTIIYGPVSCRTGTDCAAILRKIIKTGQIQDICLYTAAMGALADNGDTVVCHGAAVTVKAMEKALAGRKKDWVFLIGQMAEHGEVQVGIDRIRGEMLLTYRKEADAAEDRPEDLLGIVEM